MKRIAVTEAISGKLPGIGQLFVFVLGIACFGGCASGETGLAFSDLDSSFAGIVGALGVEEAFGVDVDECCWAAIMGLSVIGSGFR
ncbi:MAG: hypothetical protein JSR60_20445 [Proteobacteria bacterium]|nr:hypothetical protein [Pseudomonadota bacterium]